MYEIEFYEDKNGYGEVYEYIKNLNMSSNKENRVKLKKINMYLELLSRQGLKLTEPYIIFYKTKQENT